MEETIVYNMLRERLKDFLGETALNHRNIVATSIILMKSVSGFSSLSGLQKKKMIIDVMKKSVLEGKGCDNPVATRTTLLMLGSTVPDLIDTAIDLDDGVLTIKAQEPRVTGCCPIFKKR